MIDLTQKEMGYGMARNKEYRAVTQTLFSPQ